MAVSTSRVSCWKYLWGKEGGGLGAAASGQARMKRRDCRQPTASRCRMASLSKASLPLSSLSPRYFFSRGHALGGGGIFRAPEAQQPSMRLAAMPPYSDICTLPLSKTNHVVPALTSSFVGVRNSTVTETLLQSSFKTMRLPRVLLRILV